MITAGGRPQGVRVVRQVSVRQEGYCGLLSRGQSSVRKGSAGSPSTL
jgi:hypothetical protein